MIRRSRRRLFRDRRDPYTPGHAWVSPPLTVPPEPEEPNMRSPSLRSNSNRVTSPRALALVAVLALFPCTLACVTENTSTGEMVPRGNQRYPWDEVQERAKRLQNGMSKGQVLNLMGSPAEIEDEDTHWIYLPERHGILVPAQALHLTFDRGVLAEHQYRAIVLGAQM